MQFFTLCFMTIEMVMWRGLIGVAKAKRKPVYEGACVMIGKILNIHSERNGFCDITTIKVRD